MNDNNDYKKFFIAGVTAGREIEKEFIENYDELNLKYHNMVEWESERILEFYDYFKEKLNK